MSEQRPKPPSPADLALFDQATAALADSLPPALFRLYSGYLRAGFSEAQAFVLTRDYLASLNRGVRE